MIDRIFIYQTNHFILEALRIAAIYKLRWRVELIFKWIKQNLRIKHCFGTSENAVKTQIWIAVCVYLQVAILRKELNLAMSLSQILKVVSVTPFEQVVLQELLAQHLSQTTPREDSNRGCCGTKARMVVSANMDLETEVIAQTYRHLSTVEAMFRTMKWELTTRPIYHERDEAILGHVFCSFLASRMGREL